MVSTRSGRSTGNAFSAPFDGDVKATSDKETSSKSVPNEAKGSPFSTAPLSNLSVEANPDSRSPVQSPRKSSAVNLSPGTAVSASPNKQQPVQAVDDSKDVTRTKSQDNGGKPSQQLEVKVLARVSLPEQEAPGHTKEGTELPQAAADKVPPEGPSQNVSQPQQQPGEVPCPLPQPASQASKVVKSNAAISQPIRRDGDPIAPLALPLMFAFLLLTLTAAGGFWLALCGANHGLPVLPSSSPLVTSAAPVCARIDSKLATASLFLQEVVAGDRKLQRLPTSAMAMSDSVRGAISTVITSAKAAAASVTQHVTQAGERAAATSSAILGKVLGKTTIASPDVAPHGQQQQAPPAFPGV